MSFFYDLNKKLDSIRATPEVTHQQLNERDMSRAAKGIMKYGKDGMQALRDAEAEGKALDPIRKKYDKYDNKEVDEGVMDTVKSVGKKVASGINKLVGHGSDEDMRRDLQRKSGAPVTGKKPEQKTTEAAKYRDPKYKDKLYTQEPPDYTYGPDMDDAYYNPKPDDYAGRKRKIGGGEFPSTDPLERGLGIGRSGIKNNILDRGPRKGLPSRDQISSLKGSIKSARGTHAEPNLPEAAGSIDYEKVLEAIAALYGDDMWDNDAMGDLAQDLEQAGPTDRELDFIIAKGKLPTRLKGIRFTNTDDVQFGHLDEKSGDQMTATGKKLNFADKIASAKKEVDEMLGDVAAEAMRSALSPKQKKIDMNKNGKLDANDFAMLRKGAKPEMDEERSKGTAFDPDTPRAVAPKVGSVERGAKHDIKHTATGRMVTRRTDDQGNSVGADDDSDAQDGPRGRGRPKGTKNVSSKAKVFQRKSKLMTKEGEDDPAEKGEYDREGDMALDDIDTIESAANELQSIIDADDNLPEWVQSKINKAMDYLDTARDYMAAQGNDQEPIAEKAVSKQQQKFMGMAHAMQKGEKIKGASKELKKVAKTMKSKDVEDFAKTKHKGLPDKVKKKEVDENSDDGRLVTKQSEPGKTSTSSSTGRISATVDKGKVTVKPAKSGGIRYGQGIYDSMNRELENMIAESMSINMSDSTEGGKSLTITATDEDAMKLGMMLKNAGLGGGDARGGDMHSHGEEACDTCGMQDCGCGDVQEAVDENSPDWPTNTEKADNNFGYSGGLNKPKADVAGNGQSTVPVVATRPHNEDDDMRRMMEMAGIKQAELEPWKETMKEEEEDFFHNPNVPADKQLPAPPKEVELDEAEEDTVEESIQRMREMAGIREAKKEVDEEKTDEGNKFAFNVLKAKEAGKKEADLDGDGDMEKVRESIFALNNQWKAYKG